MKTGKQRLAKYRSFSHSLRTAKYHGVFNTRYWQPQNYGLDIRGYGKRIEVASRGWVRRIGDWLRELIPFSKTRKQHQLDLQYKADQEFMALMKNDRTRKGGVDQRARQHSQRRK